MMRYKYLILLSFLTIFDNSLAEKDNTYPGSQAYNKTQIIKESVNVATGTFDFSYPLIKAPGRVSSFQLAINYRFNSVGMHGLPKGWHFDLDYIDGKSVHIHNQQWLIDLLWHDETQFASGLKYYNLHGTHFEDALVAKEIPDHKGLFYRYKSSHKDGSTKYFSHQGLLVLETDRFNNTLLFEYQNPVHDLTSAKLIKITDNFSNTYSFTYAPGEIILHAPDNRVTHIYLHDKGVLKITDPLKRDTTFEYIQQNKQDLLRKIETPTGLSTQLTYGEINYKRGSETKKLPVVILLKKYDVSLGVTLQETHYSYSEDNNFTGYPLYGLSDTGDSLIDSNNQAYRYSVKVSRSNLSALTPMLHTQVFYYNYLHLPVEIQTLNHGKPYLKTTYAYAISPFKYSRSTNYDKPISVIHSIWDNDKSTFIPRDKITRSYDNYGNKRENHRFVFDPDNQQWVPVTSNTKKYFTEHFSLLAESNRIDHTSGKKIRSRYTLAKDNKTLAVKTTDYRKQTNCRVWHPWKQSEMAHDTFGRRIKTAIQWVEKNQPGVQKTFTTTSYTFNSDNAHLTVKNHSALGATKTDITDTRNGNSIQTITPMDEIYQYDYDALGRIIKITDPLNQASTIEYKDFQASGSNSVTHKTPLSFQTRTNYDALGQVISHQDYHQEGWRTLSAYTYNGWGKIVKKTNILGLSVFIEYDEQERPISALDPWNNMKNVIYDDIRLTTLTYFNQHKVSEGVSVPWQLLSYRRTFPVLNNPHDPQRQFLENTLEKNGFGQKIKKSSSFVDRYTHKKSETMTTQFTYDTSNNVIESHLTGYEGVDARRKTRYDLFSNKVTHTKTVIVDQQMSAHQGDTLTYNEDNLLMGIETPPIEGGSGYTTRHQYDKNGSLIKTTLPDQQEIDFQYNALGQLIHSTWQREGKPYNITKNYDADRRLINLTDGQNESITYRYTPNGHLTKMTYPDGRSLHYDYDDKDRVITQTDFNQMTQAYIYKPEDLGKLSEIHHINHTITQHYGMDDNNGKGRLLKRRMDFGKDGITETHMQYGSFNRLAKITTKNDQRGAVYDVDYSVNPRHQLIAQNTHSHLAHHPAVNTQINYSYDALNRLVNERFANENTHSDIHYIYDGNNNIVQEIVTDDSGKYTTDRGYNTQDQLVSIQHDNQEVISTLKYDANGYMTQDDQGVEYHYDAQGFLLTATQGKNKPLNYHYLPNGLLGERQSAGQKDSFYYSQDKKCLTQKTNNEWLSLLRSEHSILAGISKNGIAQLFNANQSTGGILTDKGNLSIITYDAYGKRHGDKATNAIDNYGWDQEYTDPALDLTYLQRRFYSPTLRRFITKDNYLGDNHYTFGKGNPISYIDPTGHNSQQALSYGLGSGITALGIAGILFAIPSGGASLTLSAGAAIGAGAATTLSGIALMGSQGALDSGNKDAAKALLYTSIGLGALAIVDAGIAIAPKVSATFFSTSSRTYAFVEVIPDSSSVSTLGDVPNLPVESEPITTLTRSPASSIPNSSVSNISNAGSFDPLSTILPATPESQASLSTPQLGSDLFEVSLSTNASSSQGSTETAFFSAVDGPGTKAHAVITSDKVAFASIDVVEMPGPATPRVIKSVVFTEMPTDLTGLSDETFAGYMTGADIH